MIVILWMMSVDLVAVVSVVVITFVEVCEQCCLMCVCIRGGFGARRLAGS